MSIPTTPQAQVSDLDDVRAFMKNCRSVSVSEIVQIAKGIESVEHRVAALLQSCPPGEDADVTWTQDARGMYALVVALRLAAKALTAPPARDDVAALVEGFEDAITFAEVLQSNIENNAPGVYTIEDVKPILGYLLNERDSIKRARQSLARVRDGGK